jgi:hypothetical protein
MMNLTLAMLGWAEIFVILAALAVFALFIMGAAVALIVIMRSDSKRRPSEQSGVPPVLDK